MVIDVRIEEKYENLSISSLQIRLTPKLCKKKTIIPPYALYIDFFYRKLYTLYQGTEEVIFCTLSEDVELKII
jgi:hypothetical protein